MANEKCDRLDFQTAYKRITGDLQQLVSVPRALLADTYLKVTQSMVTVLERRGLLSWLAAER